MRWTMLAIMLLLTAGQAPASRLCRDTKGLFTPCTGEPTPAQHRRHRIDRAERGETADAARKPGGDTPAPSHRDKPPLFGNSKLCRDTKGLFTPCPR